MSGGPEPESPFTLLDTAAHLRQEGDRALEARLQSLPGRGTEITCRAGCSACCRQLVMVSALEAAAIAAYVAGDPSRETRFRAALARWEEHVGAHPDLAAGLDELWNAEGYLPGEAGAALEEEYWRARIPCPFLEEDRCSIYPVRPFACREHFVTSDPALCDQSLDGPVHAGTRMEFRAVAAWVGVRCFGLPDRSVPLPRALDVAAAHGVPEPRPVAPAEARAAVETGRRRVRMALARLGLAG